MKILALSLIATGVLVGVLLKLMAYAIWWDGITMLAIFLGLIAIVIMQVFLIVTYDRVFVKKVLKDYGVN